jgi:hypothetical protein
MRYYEIYGLCLNKVNLNKILFIKKTCLGFQEHLEAFRIAK